MQDKSYYVTGHTEDVHYSQGVSASVVTYILSGGALNATQ